MTRDRNHLLVDGLLLLALGAALLWAAVSGAQPAPLNLNGQPLTAVLCDGGVVCSRRGSVATIIVTASGSGSGGSVNTASGSVYFDGGALDARATVTAAWATGSSVITCSATGEEASVEGLVVTVLSKASGSFVVRAEPRNGTHRGALPFECVGN